MNLLLYVIELYLYLVIGKLERVVLSLCGTRDCHTSLRLCRLMTI